MGMNNKNNLRKLHVFDYVYCLECWFQGCVFPRIKSLNFIVLTKPLYIYYSVQDRKNQIASVKATMEKLSYYFPTLEDLTITVSKRCIDENDEYNMLELLDIAGEPEKPLEAVFEKIKIWIP